MIMNKPSRFRSLVFALTWAASGLAMSPLGLTQALYAQHSCDVKEYAEFVSYAQILNPLAEDLGRRMVQCDNRDFRESSFYWLSFFYSMTDQQAKIAGLASLMPPETDTSPKGGAQRAAFRGNTQVLVEKIFTSTPGYIDDPWIVMSLARAQMSLGEYPKAFANYIRVLRLKEEQDAAEVELLYAYIWARDHEAAAGKLASLKRYDSSAYMRQSLERAEALLQGHREEPKGRHDSLSLAYVQERDNRGYSAVGGRAHFEGIVDLELEALEHANPLEEEKENVANVNLGKEWGNKGESRLLTELGYFSVGADRVTGKLKLTLPMGEQLEGALGIARKPVSALERPPAGERAGIMRDSAFWDLDWKEHLSLTGAVHREDNDAMFEDYGAEIKFGALPKGEDDRGFGLIIPLSYRHRPSPSPDYRSFPHDARVGIGLRLGLSDQRYSVYTEAVLESIQRDDYGNENSFEKLLGARMKAHLRYYYQKAFYNFFEGSAFVIEKMPGEKADERKAEFLIGFGLSQASH